MFRVLPPPEAGAAKAASVSFFRPDGAGPGSDFIIFQYFKKLLQNIKNIFLKTLDNSAPEGYTNSTNPQRRKKDHMKKMLCLALAFVLIFALFAGCTKGGGETANTPAPAANSGSSNSGNSGSSNSGSSNSGSSGTENAGGAEAEDTGNQFTPNPPIDWGNYPASDVTQDLLPYYDIVATTKPLPLCGEKTTFSAWWPMGASQFLTTFNDAAAIQEMENRTNIHIDYFHPSTSEMTAAFPLMVAAGDYTDMVFYAGLYTGGGDKAISDGVFIRLNELIDEYAPNYNFIRNYTEDGRKMTITSSGTLWSFYNVCYMNMPGYMGLNMRKDFMERCGLTERPVTIDDWDHYLDVMFHGIDEAEYALAIPPSGVTRHSAFTSAWGIGSDWYQKDGKALYGPAQPEFRNYVQLMHDWYEKGYIRSDFFGVAPDNYNWDITWEEYGKGKCVAADGSNCFGGMLAQYGNEDAYGIAIRQPVLQKGDEIHIRYDQGVVNKGVSNAEQLAITTACKNPELLVSWVDYRYTYDGYLLTYYGIEGYTYQKIDNYKIALTTLITEDPDVSGFQAMGKYIPTYGAVLGEYTYGWCFIDPAYPEEIMVWAEDKCDQNYPDIEMLNAEDAGEYAAIYNDVKTYVEETIPKYIIGQLSMDKFDDYYKTLSTMNLDRAVAIKQAALDDYNGR